MKYLTHLAFFFLGGCSTLASREATVVCQAADTVTTIVALNSGATEANPLMAGMVKSLGIPGFVAVKVLVTWMLVAYHDEIHEPTLATINVATCGVAAHNISVIGTLP